MALDFLNSLKNAVETGEFNSDAAKKIEEINEINKLVDEKIKNKYNDGKVNFPKIQPENVELEKEASELQSEYEQKMEVIRQKDSVNIANKQLATLIEIEDMVKLSIEDMYSFVQELENKFGNELKSENQAFGDLFLKIEEIKSKYVVRD